MSELTAQKTWELFNYDHLTGVFRWKRSLSNRVPVGSIAGSNQRNGYLGVKIGPKRYSLHRLAFLYMTGETPEEHIDHINHDRKDNRWANLRKADPAINSKNRSLSKTNKTGVSGVLLKKGRKHYTVRINVDGKEIGLGNFPTLEEAASVRLEAEKKYGYHENHGRKENK